MLFRLQRLFRSAGRDITALWYACRNPATPRGIKIAAALMVAYLISPIDLLPDAIPIIGVLDDITLATLAIPFLLRMLPAQARIEADQRSDAFLSRFAFWRR
jgi:uncharacterized membrane protein YkvA (DUF1232 family)